MCKRSRVSRGLETLIFLLEASLRCVCLDAFFFHLFCPCEVLCVLLRHTYCMCPYVYLHMRGKVDIPRRSEMRDPPPWFVYNPPLCLFIHLGGSFPSQQITTVPVISCILCLSAPNTFLCVSPLFYLQIPPCHRKKVRQHSISHLWIPVCFQMWVCCSACPCVFSVFC